MFFLFFSGSWIASSACMCSNFHRDMDKAYKEYSFIAHVKILKKFPLTIADRSLVHSDEELPHHKKLSVEIIELFKGTRGTTLLEWGVSSFCDMGLRENDEWILFGSYVNKDVASVSYCKTWFFLKNAVGERQWLYDSGLSAVKQLRKIAGKPEKAIADKRMIVYYSDGKISANEEYKNEILEGKRKIYFSNGQLMEECDYING